VGDHVVMNPMAAPSGIIGNGGATGALADYLLIERAVRGTSLEVVPDHMPFEVAALNEPMAVARHGVNQDAAGAPAVIDTALTAAKPGAKVAVVAVHKEPVPVDFLNVMSNEITIVGSMGYPKEIFEVTKDIIANSKSMPSS
jgi:threonine dehydrogenase-like Zn-dependent dehydrogenase